MRRWCRQSGCRGRDLSAAATEPRQNAQHSLELAPEFASRVLRDVSMAKHTSWHAGGSADVFFTPRDIMDLASFVRQLPAEVPLLWIGLGSNLLVRDGGVRGAVVATHGALGALERHSATRIRAEAGVPCARIARQCVKWGLGPAEFFAGIPGTLGGALAMNAGAWGEETWPHVVEVEVLDRRGIRHTRTPADYSGYRQVTGPGNEWFIGARLEFERRPGVTSDAIKSFDRRATQPIGEWAAVRCSPTAAHHAAQLIDSAGLKGFRIGDASVSTSTPISSQSGAARAPTSGGDSACAEDGRAVHGIELHRVRIVGIP